MPDDVITTDRLVVRYRGKTALDGLDLRVPRGAVYAFLGDNGAGKTTTMKILTGLAPADAGRAFILGRDCWTRATELRHRVGYMPERPRFYDWMSVTDIGWFTASFHRPGFLPRYREWAERLGLDPTKKLKDLSKGGYARVGLALALAQTRKCYCSTRPTSGLDLLTRANSSPASSARRERRTILISATRSAELERPARTSAAIADGKMILSSTLEELRKKVRRLQSAVREPPAGRRTAGNGAGAERTGRFWQVLVQDPDAAAVAAAPSRPGVSDFEDVPVTLEEVYAALMARSANGSARRDGNPLVRRGEQN